MNPAIHKASRLCWCLAVCGFLNGCRSLYLADEDLVFQEVFYLSMRNESESTDPESRYGGERGPVSYGVAMLALDSEDSYTSLEQAQPNRVLQQSKRKIAGKVQQVQSLDYSSFLQHLKNYSMTDGPVKDVLVFIHGFRKDFARTIANAAHLRHQLAFTGPVITFSWPSNNSFTGYLSDMENVDWSQPQLRELILALSQQLPQAEIHVIAHSVGNRALIQTLIEMRDLKLENGNWPLGEIVMLAPDFDKARFIEEISRHIQDIPSRITLYVSDADFPLMTAAQVFQYPRLGDSREGVPVVEGIETIDVSDAVYITAGHGYYEQTPIVIEDLFYLINERKGASDRPNMKEVETSAGTYWRLQPADEENQD